MKDKALTLIIVLVLVAGISVLLYPTVSDYWNTIHQSRVVSDYSKMVSTLSNEDNEKLWAAADAYNQSLLTMENRLITTDWTDAQKAEYASQLSVDGNQVMGYLDIPTISVKLPIYHGTEENVLQVGIGHIEGSSMPVGGPSTHCVLSGHTGLPSATLLTNLDQMKIGDLFYLTVLDQTLAYRVDQVLVVEPDNVDPLAITPGEDYVTLITCTPYGINSHRLLVRGARVFLEEQKEKVTLTSDIKTLSTWVIVAVFGAPVLLLCFIGFLIRHAIIKYHKRKQRA
jgi:sortase A